MYYLNICVLFDWAGAAAAAAKLASLTVQVLLLLNWHH